MHLCHDCHVLLMLQVVSARARAVYCHTIRLDCPCHAGLYSLGRPSFVSHGRCICTLTVIVAASTGPTDRFDAITFAFAHAAALTSLDTLPSAPELFRRPTSSFASFVVHFFTLRTDICLFRGDQAATCTCRLSRYPAEPSAGAVRPQLDSRRRSGQAGDFQVLTEVPRLFNQSDELGAWQD